MAFTINKACLKQIAGAALLGLCFGACRPEVKTRQQPATQEGQSLTLRWEDAGGQWQLNAASAQQQDSAWVITGFHGQFISKSAPENPLSIKAPKTLFTTDKRHLSGTELVLQSPEWFFSGKNFSTVENLNNWEIKSVQARFYLEEP